MNASKCTECTYVMKALSSVISLGNILHFSLDLLLRLDDVEEIFFQVEFIYDLGVFARNL